MGMSGRFQRTTKVFLGTIFGTLWLLFLYTVTFWLVIGSLSALQVRDERSKRIVQTVPFDFNQADRARSFLDRALNRIDDTLASRDDFFKTREQQITQMNTIANIFRGNQDAVPNSFVDSTFFETSAEFIGARAYCSIQPDGTRKDDFNCDPYYEYLDTTAKLTALYEAGAEKKSSEFEQAALAQFKEIKDLSDFVDINDFFRTWGFDRFLTAPRQILVMVLTVVMGVLGSVITMTWTFVRRDTSLSIRRFLFLPFVGGMSAFIILIFLRAGQLTLTAGDTQDELSPFVLSFVGIISGLLSERAYARMSEVGNGLFATDAGELRWGVRLNEAVAAAGLTAAEIAEHLGLDVSDTEDIIDGKAAASPSHQRLIAAFLRLEPRVLFTDLPPPGILDSGRFPNTPGPGKAAGNTATGPAPDPEQPLAEGTDPQATT